MGYLTTEILISELVVGTLNILTLERSAIDLQEAIVTGKRKRNLSAKQIVQKAIDAIPRNYPSTSFSTVGYYRDYQFKEDERTFVVCPHLGYKKAKPALKYLFTPAKDLEVSAVKYAYGDIRDDLGNKLDERKWEYLHQYREFFTQETLTSYESIDEFNLMKKTLPLDNPEQPMPRRALQSEYWKNTPLPVIKN